MLDKHTSKIYRKIVTAKSNYEAFQIVDKLDPHTAKRVLMALVMSRHKES